MNGGAVNRLGPTLGSPCLDEIREKSRGNPRDNQPRINISPRRVSRILLPLAVDRYFVPSFCAFGDFVSLVPRGVRLWNKERVGG